MSTIFVPHQSVCKTNSHDGLQEHWFCYNKGRKGTCDARNIRGYRLRDACCEVLELESFDENVFSKAISKIVTTDTDILEFHFYDGTVKTARIHYFSRNERSYIDPHKKPFGYRWSRNGYVIHEQEAEAVRLICQYYLDGWSISDISRELEAKGYKSVRGKISRKLVTYVLDSEFYFGRRIIKGKFSSSGKDEIIEHDHEPLVSREIFDAVQVRRAEELARWKHRRKI